MKIALRPEMDKDGEGYFKVTRTGHYRFSLVFTDSDNEDEMIVRVDGFRVDRNLTEILPPLSIINGRTPMTLARLGNKYEDKILAYFRDKLVENPAVRSSA